MTESRDFSPLAVFRFHASPTTGGGHAMRSGALATALAEEGWRTLCATRNETIATAPRALEPFDEVVPLRAAGGEINEIAACAGGSCEAVVIDHYGWDRALHRACRRIAPCVVVIEDRREALHDGDILVNQSIEPDGVRSGAEVPGGLVGPRYALLRPIFRRARAPGWSGGDQGRILLLCGYADERNLTERLFDVIDRAPGVRTVDVVLGAANMHRESVQRCLRRAATPSHLHVDPPSLASLMTRASLAVTTAGSTCWELACLGVPMVTVVAAANQAPVARTLLAAGAGGNAGDVDDSLDVRLREQVVDLLADGAGRRRMAVRGRSLVDGLGAVRVARAISARSLSRG